ncbi:MAG: AAA family ATPase [Bacteroidales bacterium]|nr:AAA family ATPase [Candidatus Physcocola equi]
MSIDFTKFTNKSRSALLKAVSLTKECQYASVEPQVMMVAVFQEGNDMVPFLLDTMEVDKNAFFSAIGDSLRLIEHNRVLDPEFTATLESILEEATTLAENEGFNVVALEFVFWAFFRVSNPVKDLMIQFGVTAQKIEHAIRLYHHDDDLSSEPSRFEEENLPNLRKYGVNLNVLAEDRTIEPAIGRDEEIRRILQILSRKTKNNPILIGEPGTGKTAVVEGLAHRIVRGDVPDELKNLILYSLDLASLIAGAQMQGEFEHRLKQVITDVKSNPNVVLFIDEIHLIIGAGKNGGAMDAANILKPELARGGLNIIGATTLDEYREYIEKDKAFERRFQKILINEPDEDSAITIMRGIKSRFENHHHIKILDDAIVAAVKLSSRYISDRFLPDKAIDLLDEAASSMRIDRFSSPHDLEMIKRQIMNKEIERESLIQDESPASLEQIDCLSVEIADLQEKENELNAKWQNECRRLTEYQELTSQLQRLQIHIEEAELHGRNRIGEVVELQRRESSLRRQVEELFDEIGSIENPLLKTALDEKDIMKVVTSWTGIPMSNLTQDESERLLHIEDVLHNSVIGQNDAIKVVSESIRRNRMGFGDQRKPIGSFLFLGTTGVGKTELCKALAEYLFDSRDMMIRIDMSEYQQEYSVSRLFGAPPGYVGYEQGGQLTEAVRRKPYSVILLDEVEKAHKKVFETLLQVLDDGRMTDGQGHVVNFKNTIIIMTSNIGSDIISDSVDIEGNIQEEDMIKNQIISLMKHSISPEFVNRIDDIVMFKPLQKEDIKKIVNLQVNRLKDNLLSNNLLIEFSQNVINRLTELSFDTSMGARPVKRAINDNIVNGLTLKLLTHQVEKDKTINVDCVDGVFIFQN